MLYAWGLLAWVILVTHQRLNVKHSITSFFFRRSNINNTKYIKEDLYDDLFYSWLIGFTEAKGSFFFFCLAPWPAGHQLVREGGMWCAGYERRGYNSQV